MSADNLTWVDITGTVVTLGAPILLEVLSQRGRRRFACEVVDIRVEEIDVNVDGKVRTYRLVDEVLGAEAA